jgi:DNA-binding CsgD family transcriptional regulator
MAGENIARQSAYVVALTHAQVAALRTLVASEPVPGHPLPSPAVLACLERLVPEAALGAAVQDLLGYVVEELAAPRSFGETLRSLLPPAPTPHPPGRWTRSELSSLDSSQDLLADAVTISVPSGPAHVTTVCVARAHGRLSAEDLARLALVTPVVQRVCGQPPAPQLASSLTRQERVVLAEVAHGRSTSEIAARLGVAPSTVRKHLEHAYPKLGVHGRVAAVARLVGAAGWTSD